MARENRTKYVILGVLSTESMSGYEIKQTVNHDLGFFWFESDGQIYPTLKSLLEDGLITLDTTINQTSKRDKKIYSINKKGKNELQIWLSKHEESFHIRNEFLLKIFYGYNSDNETNLSRIYNQKFRFKQKLDILESLKKNIHLKKESYTSEEPGFFWLITIDYGITSIKALIEWCDNTINLIKKSRV
ncbi:MAG: PadR family transcriptional regulator [bacterium]|nr:PadR family transcriptional regulator [bacterium]